VKPYSPLPREYYTRRDVLLIAKELLGKVIYTYINNELTAGIITETEAYAGITDKASHAYNNRRTSRTEIMYKAGGYAYVYLCYGIHSLFNVVTSIENEPHAILIRSIEPLHGIEIMSRRIGKPIVIAKSGIGPGNVSKLLGINITHSGLILAPEKKSYNQIWIQDENCYIHYDELKINTRIGIDYAEEDALLPYRFIWQKKAP